MPEENQIQMNQTPTPMNSNIRERLSWLRSFREGAVLRKAKQTQNTLDADSNNLFEQSLNVNNKELSQKYNQASQSAAAASMIKSYAERNGDDWSDLNTPQEILTEYFTLNPDDETYNKIMDFTQSNRDPEEFWLEMWWIEPIKETFMDKAKNSIVWPFARAIWALGWGAYWLWEWVYNASKRPWEFTQRELDRWYLVEDPNSPTGYSDWEMSFKDKIKRYWKFFGTLGNMVWDVAWGTLMGAAEWFTTHQEQEAVKDKVAEVAAAILNSESGEKVQSMYNELDEGQKQELKDWASIIDWLSDLPLSFLWGKAAKEWVKQTIKAWESEFVKKWIKKIDDAIENRATSRLINSKATNVEELRRIANVIGQWETKDIDNSVKALKSILGDYDSSNIKTFADLRKAWANRVSKLSKQVDDNLSKQTWKITLADQHIVNVDWKPEWRYIESAIEDLKDVYTKQRDPESLNKVIEFEKKVSWDGVSYKELNDFVREYWVEMDAWNKKNELTTNAKVWTEQTRWGIKKILQERMPDSEFRDIDAEIGSVSNFNKLVDKTVERVNNVEKQLRDKWILETVRSAWADFKSSIRWDLRWDTQNIYRVEKTLPEKIEIFNELSNDISNAESAEEALNLINRANEEIRVWLTTVKWYEEQPFDSLVNYASMLEWEWDLAWAKEVLDYTLKNSEKDIKETLWDSLSSIEKTVWRYGSNEPTFFLKVNNDSADTIKKIADLAKKYKQNSFFTAKKASSSAKYWPVAWKPWTAIEPWVIIKTEKSIDNMADFDKILKDAWFDGATLLPWWKWIELYNLSQFWWTPESTVEWIKKLMNNKELIDKYWIADINDWKFEIMHIWMKQSWRPDWAWNQQWLWTYDELSKYLKSLSNK